MVLVYYPASAYIALGIAKRGVIESEFERHVDTYRRLFACQPESERLFHESYGDLTVEDVVLETLSGMFRSHGDIFILQTVEVTTDIDFAKKELSGPKMNHDGVVLGIATSADEFSSFMHPCKRIHYAARKLQVREVPEVHIQESARQCWDLQVRAGFAKFDPQFLYF
jgi:hypothetical protein